jgi:hypothetical protein
MEAKACQEESMHSGTAIAGRSTNGNEYTDIVGVTRYYPELPIMCWSDRRGLMSVTST